LKYLPNSPNVNSPQSKGGVDKALKQLEDSLGRLKTAMGADPHATRPEYHDHFVKIHEALEAVKEKLYDMESRVAGLEHGGGSGVM
jgi:hypothetical protein